MTYLSSCIVELLQLVLTNNCFDFNGKYMGTKLAPPHARLFKSRFEGQHVYT